MSHPNRYLVSIIVPSFNQGRFLRETLDSILNQDYRPVEVLVLDGGSTDETVTILRTYTGTPELQWWSEPDDGIEDAVNTGLRRARGSIVGIQSSDDLYRPGAIRKAVEAFARDPELALVYGDVEYIDAESNVRGRETLEPFNLARYLGRFTYIPQPTAFFRASVAAVIGGWRKECSYAADADYWMRIAIEHKVSKLNHIMGSYRYHDGQRDSEKALVCRDWERTVTDLLVSGRLDRRLRPWAHMGIHLARYRYCPERDWLLRTLHLYRAVLANPVGVMDPCFPKRELLPGRVPIWKLLSRIKRKLGFPPRRDSATTSSVKRNGTSEAS